MTDQITERSGNSKSCEHCHKTRPLNEFDFDSICFECSEHYFECSDCGKIKFEDDFGDDVCLDCEAKRDDKWIEQFAQFYSEHGHYDTFIVTSNFAFDHDAWRAWENFTEAADFYREQYEYTRNRARIEQIDARRRSILSGGQRIDEFVDSFDPKPLANLIRGLWFHKQPRPHFDDSECIYDAARERLLVSIPVQIGMKRLVCTNR